MSKVCSPTCMTQPQITSSTRAGSTPVRSTIACSTRADRSAEWMPARPPLRLPTGVRTASTMTASRTAYLQLVPVNVTVRRSVHGSLVTMDTLIIPVPRRRAYGLFAIAVVLVVVAVLSDPAGRLLAVPAALVTLVLAVRDLTSGPVLSADAAGVEVLQGLRTITADWPQVERMRVVK